MSDYAYGINPPYDDPKGDMIDRIIEDSTSDVLNSLDDMIMQEMMGLVRDAIHENTPEIWYDTMLDHKDNIEDAVYAQCRERILRMFDKL